MSLNRTQNEVDTINRRRIVEFGNIRKPSPTYGPRLCSLLCLLGQLRKARSEIYGRSELDRSKQMVLGFGQGLGTLDERRSRGYPHPPSPKFSQRICMNWKNDPWTLQKTGIPVQSGKLSPM